MRHRIGRYVGRAHAVAADHGSTLRLQPLVQDGPVAQLPLQGGAAAATWRETHIAPHVQSLRDSIVGPPSQLLWFVFGSVLVVLLVACINIAGLLLVRAERAQMELAAARLEELSLRAPRAGWRVPQ